MLATQPFLFPSTLYVEMVIAGFVQLIRITPVENIDGPLAEGLSVAQDALKSANIILDLVSKHSCRSQLVAMSLSYLTVVLSRYCSVLFGGPQSSSQINNG